MSWEDETDDGAQHTIDVSEPQYQEGQVLSINYTAAGPVRVVWSQGQKVVQGPTPNPNFEIPGGLSKWELEQFWTVGLLYETLIEKDQSRKLPMLVAETEMLLPKTIIKKFNRKGLMGIKTLMMTNDKGQKNSRAFCWFTDNGYGLLEVLREQQATAAPETPAPDEAKDALESVEV